MAGLPEMVYGDGIGKYTQIRFGGYNHNLYAQDGELWDMENLTGDLYPLLSPRKPRWLARTLTKPNGLFAKDGLFWADGAGFFAGGVKKGEVSDSEKRFAALGPYVVILPDKAYYNRQTGAFGSLEASWSGSAAIQNGTFAGETAEANTIHAPGSSGVFREGDAVTISGAKAHPENNTMLIIREVDGDYLILFSN